MSKIAPWPWGWDGPVWDYDIENEARWLLDAEGNPVLQGEIKCRDENHAHLIAAAPELLAACKALLVVMDCGSKPRKLDEALTWRENDELARSIAIAAIAKAEPGAEGEKG